MNYSESASQSLDIPSLVEFRDLLIHFIDSNVQIQGIEELRLILKNENLITDTKKSSPGTPETTEIKDTGEKAFQRSIFRHGKIILDYNEIMDYDTVNWLDFEIPVTLGEFPRRNCVDLIGSTGDKHVICELKFIKSNNSNSSKSNHPLYGVIELLAYYYLIRCNYKKLDDSKVYHKFDNKINSYKWTSIANDKSPKLLLVANKSYWDYWFSTRKNIDKKDILQSVEELSLKLGLNIYLFGALDVNFDSQKNGKKTYTPSITSETWIEIQH